MDAHPLLLTRRAFAAVLAAAAVATPARARAAPMLARAAPAGIDPTGYLVSEKYDGVRALWDGSSLRFRSGRRVAAPRWFSARLPAEPLDGELWIGRGRFEALVGAVRRSQPVDAEWQRVSYMVFDQPARAGRYADRAARLQAQVQAVGWPQLVAAPQRTLPDAASLRRQLDAVVAAGGEGLMLHRADAVWTPGRSDALLKLKALDDAEAVVVAHLPGSGRHAGRLGALQVRADGGAVFAIGTGYSDAQRVDPPPVGSVVTYTHRGLTNAGVPRFASFLRAHPGI